MQNSGSRQSSQGLLLFRLNQQQMFAVGTLKVREIIPYQPLSAIPQSHPAVTGTVHTRGHTIPVIDLAAAVGYRPIAESEFASCSIIVTDCQRQLVGFLVRKIERIIDTSWRNIRAVPAAAGKHIYSSGIISFDDQLIQLLDIELLLSRIFPMEEGLLHAHISDVEQEALRRHPILLVDDSAVARKQVAEALNHVDVPFDVCTDGNTALQMMKDAADRGEPYDLLVSDIEMPGLDGYELAFEVRNDPRLQSMYIILHTSLSSEISVDRAHQVGANEALTKFDAPVLVSAMLRGVGRIEEGRVVSGVESRLQQ